MGPLHSKSYSSQTCIKILLKTSLKRLAKHTSTCTEEIDWENAKIVRREQRWTQRKYLEGNESLREKNKGITPLNSYNQLVQWLSTLFPFFEKGFARRPSTFLPLRVISTQWKLVWTLLNISNKWKVLKVDKVCQSQAQPKTENYYPLRKNDPFLTFLLTLEYHFYFHTMLKRCLWWTTWSLVRLVILVKAFYNYLNVLEKININKK